MADVKWIKIATDIFDDEKILIIEKLPNSDGIIVIWFKLLTLAGKQNNSGVFIMNNRIAYTDEMLAAIFRRELNLVKMALSVFEQYGMIEIVEGALTIPNWSKHQTLDKIAARTEYQKNYMKDYREKQKLLACNTNSKPNSKQNVDNCNVNVSETEEELEEELDKEDKEDKENIVVPDGTCGAKTPPTDYQQIVNTWNSLELSQITKITTSSTRQRMIKCRIKEYGIENFLKAINNIRHSKFLNGENDRGWIITFDWFLKPNNFQKVLEGNYTTSNQTSTKTTTTSVNSKVQKFNNMYSHDWDFDELERKQREHITEKLKKEGKYEHNGRSD